MTKTRYGVTWATSDHSVAQTGYDFDLLELAFDVARSGPEAYGGTVDGMCAHYPEWEGKLYARIEADDDMTDVFETEVRRDEYKALLGGEVVLIPFDCTDEAHVAAEAECSKPVQLKTLDFVLAPVPDSPNQYFVEVEDMNGNGVRMGEYVLRDDGYHAIRFQGIVDVTNEGCACDPTTGQHNHDDQ